MKDENKELTDLRIRSLVMHSILLAIITLLTLFASVPLPVGNGGAYLNAGDAAVYASAYLLGPAGGAIVSALGSALADVLHGSVIYAPATFIIKGLMAFICGHLLRKLKKTPPIIAGVVMPAGYFLFELLVFDLGAALFGLWTNAIQYAFGTAAGILLFIAFERAGFVKFGEGLISRERRMKQIEDENIVVSRYSDEGIKEMFRRYCGQMVGDRLSTGIDGNISFYDRARGRVFVTPDSIPFGEIGEEDVVILTPEGEPIEKPHEPDPELWLNLNIYKARPKVCAIVHTHSPAIVKLAESDVIPFDLPVAPYYPEGSQELAEGSVEHLKDAVAVLLRGHGAFIVGKNLSATYMIAQEIEKMAETMTEGQ